MPLLRNHFCRWCRSSHFRRSHTKNLIERAISFAILPVRCQYCGRRRYSPRWIVSQLGETAVTAPERTKGPRVGATSNIKAESPNVLSGRQRL